MPVAITTETARPFSPHGRTTHVRVASLNTRDPEARGDPHPPPRKLARRKANDCNNNYAILITVGVMRVTAPPSTG